MTGGRGAKRSRKPNAAMTEQREGANADDLTATDEDNIPQPWVTIQSLVNMAPLAGEFPGGEHALAGLRRDLKQYPFLEGLINKEGRSIIIEGIISYIGLLMDVYSDPDGTKEKRSSAKEIRDSLLTLAEDLEGLIAKVNVMGDARNFVSRALRATLQDAISSGASDKDSARMRVPPLKPEDKPLARLLAKLAAELRAEASDIQVRTGRPKIGRSRLGLVARSLACCWFSATIQQPRQSQGPDRKRGTFTEFVLLAVPLILPGTPAAQIRTAARRAVEDMSAGRIPLLADEPGEPGWQRRT